MTAGFERPEHLRPLLFRLARAEAGGLRLCFSVPPRHGKSETLLHFIAWLLFRNPGIRVLYVTHTAAFARKQSKRIRRLAVAAGVEIRTGSNRADEWDTTSGGGLVARGVGGEITGRGFDMIVVDDPTKNRAVAESSLARENAATWFSDDCFTRLAPKGSIAVVHARWHVDDLIARLAKQGFELLNLPAVNDNGEALWAAGGWTLEVLEERRRILGEYSWASLYQGAPRPRGGKVFGPPRFYKRSELPTSGYRIAHGLDLAYTNKTQSDWSVDFVMMRKGDLYYVVSVKRMQKRIRAFAVEMGGTPDEKGKRTGGRGRRWPGPMRFYGSTTEVGTGELLGEMAGLPINSLLAPADKFVRAQPFAAAWNDGRVLLPHGDDEAQPDWVEALISEFADFTGAGDVHDDIVDAGAACFDELDSAMPMPREQPDLPPLSRWDGFDGKGF